MKERRSRRPGASRFSACADSPAGTDTRGTNNNCGNGYTPWGTYLTCEENFTNVIARAAGDNALRSAKEVVGLNRYGMTQGRRSPYLWDTAGSDDLYARWSASVTGASAGPSPTCSSHCASGSAGARSTSATTPS